MGPHRHPFIYCDYTADAERRCAAFHKKKGRIINLITVQEIIEDRHVQKM